ncbi:MAG TPA: sugar ABC transporter permease, partial [Clostridiales bacterium]|nr:sugar ABC transporter permease [Clostridiales bacterium]
MKLKIGNEIKWFSLVIPALFFYLVFMIFPSLSAVYYSFTEWDGITSKFIGLENYINIFKDQKVLGSLRNAALYTIFITVIQNIYGLALAIMLDRKLRGISVIRMMFFMPAVFSSLVLGYVWGFILQPNYGLVNTILGKLGLESLQLDWLGDSSIAVWMIILVVVWQCAGYTMVIYIAGLQSISKDYYEAADIDGASFFNKFKNITFPLIAPSFTINVILCLIGTLKLFDPIYALTRGGPSNETESLASMIFS